MFTKRKLLLVLATTGLLLTAGANSGRATIPAPSTGTQGGHAGPSAPAWAPQMSPAIQVTGYDYDAKWPDVAYNSTYDEYLVVWKGGQSIWGRRVSSRGEPLGAEFEIATGPTWNDTGPHVAYDPGRNRYLVVWLRHTGLVYLMYGRFIAWDGPTPGMTEFSIDSSKTVVSESVAVAYAATQDEFLVVWSTRPTAITPVQTVARRVEADGSGFPAGTFTVTSHPFDNRGAPDLAYNANRNEYLVVVDDYPKVNENIYGVRLSGSGTLLGGGEFTIAGWPDDEQYPAVAACHTADQYLVAWHSLQTAIQADGVYARLVAGDGTPGTVLEIAHFGQASYYRPVDAACGVFGLLLEDPHYLAAWATHWDVEASNYAREVYPNGLLSEPVQTAYWGGAPAVAGGDINYLVVWDTDGDDRDGYTDIYVRIVGNTRPWAAFTVAPEEGDSTTEFQFDASSSTDATDLASQLQVRWDWDHDDVYDTAWSYTKTATHKFVLADWQSVAYYLVQLEVTDGHGTSNATSRQVTVHNAPPTSAFSVDYTIGDTETDFIFDPSDSSDPEGSALTVRWDWEDDGTYDTAWGTETIEAHRYPTPGTYTVRLEVRDNWELTDSSTVQVTVQPAGGNTPPHASFTATPPSGATGTVFSFDASGSTDAEDGSPPEVRWDWEDDGTFDTNWGAAKTANHAFGTAGTYTVRLEVRDSGGLTDSTTRSVTVGLLGTPHRVALPLVFRDYP